MNEVKSSEVTSASEFIRAAETGEHAKSEAQSDRRKLGGPIGLARRLASLGRGCAKCNEPGFKGFAKDIEFS